MLKASGDREGYGNWEKKNRLWEIQNGLVPIAEGDKEEEMNRSEIRFFIGMSTRTGYQGSKRGIRKKDRSSSYNEKEYNVCKYKVLKIEKVNCSPLTNTYWVTVKVLNLTLGTPVETFQIHAGTRYVNTDKFICCCRPKEEPIIGLPSCEFCFGLLPEGRVTGGGQKP